MKLAERVYLDIPMDSRYTAQGLGCFYDRERRQWWISGSLALKNLKRVSKWMPRHATSLPPGIRRRDTGLLCPGCGEHMSHLGPTLCRRCRRKQNPQR